MLLNTQTGGHSACARVRAPLTFARARGDGSCWQHRPLSSRSYRRCCFHRAVYKYKAVVAPAAAASSTIRGSVRLSRLYRRHVCVSNAAAGPAQQAQCLTDAA